MSKTRLCQLAEKYGSDKVASIFHDYTPFYDQLLSGRDIRRVLEIGIGTPNAMSHMKEYKTGASLRMWAEYFPTAEVWGVDNDPSALISENRIESLQFDQSSKTDLLALCSCFRGLKVDLILDDGSHQVEHQALTAKILIPRLLSRNGVYIIEDVMYRRELYALLHFPVEVKIFNLGRTWDDCVFYIEGSRI